MIFTFRTGFFKVHFKILLIGPSANSIAQTHIKVGKICSQGIGAVQSLLLIVVHYPVDITGLAVAIAIDC